MPTTQTEPTFTPIPAAMLDLLAIISYEVSKLARGTADDVAESIATIDQAAHRLRTTYGNEATAPQITRYNGALIAEYQPSRAVLSAMGIGSDPERMVALALTMPEVLEHVRAGEEIQAIKALRVAADRESLQSLGLAPLRLCKLRVAVNSVRDPRVKAAAGIEVQA